MHHFNNKTIFKYKFYRIMRIYLYFIKIEFDLYKFVVNDLFTIINLIWRNINE